MQKKGYDCVCLGGGRISHQSQDKKIHVYGYSMVSPQPRAWVGRGPQSWLGETWPSKLPDLGCSVFQPFSAAEPPHPEPVGSPFLTWHDTGSTQGGREPPPAPLL